MELLEIRNLSAGVEGKPILKNLSLSLKAGEVHAIMGPNGSGKSTLAQVLAGRCEYEVTGGSVLFQGADLLAMKPEERARAGVFLAFQYPVEIPGVNSTYFLRAALNECRKARGEAGTGPDGVPQAGQAKKQDPRTRPRPAQPLRQRGLFRRRKKTQRDFPDGRPRTHASPSWMKPIPAWTLTP